MNWDKGRFAVQRECTCKSKNSECRREAWHTVDTHDDLGATIADVITCALWVSTGIRYRAVEVSTGAVVMEPIRF